MEVFSLRFFSTLFVGFLLLFLFLKRDLLLRRLRIAWQKFMVSVTFGSKGFGTQLPSHLRPSEEEEGEDEMVKLATKRMKQHFETIAAETDLEWEISKLLHGTHGDGDEQHGEIHEGQNGDEPGKGESEDRRSRSGKGGGDPRKQPCLMRVQPLVKGTHCLFAKRAKLWGCSPWDGDLTVEENVERDIEALKLFTTKAAKGWHLDGFLFEIPSPSSYSSSSSSSTTSASSSPSASASISESSSPSSQSPSSSSSSSRGRLLAREVDISSVEGFGEVFRRVLFTINSHDTHPISRKCLDYSTRILNDRISRPGWFFEFMNESFFITTFCPFYSSISHPRHAISSSSCWILFQPEFSFAFHQIGNDTSVTNWTNPQTIRDKIRVEFKTHGRGYHIPENISYSPAIDYIKPLQLSDPNIYVQWWKTPCVIGPLPTSSSSSSSSPPSSSSTSSTASTASTGSTSLSSSTSASS